MLLKYSLLVLYPDYRYMNISHDETNTLP